MTCRDGDVANDDIESMDNDAVLNSHTCGNGVVDTVFNNDVCRSF